MSALPGTSRNSHDPLLQRAIGCDFSGNLTAGEQAKKTILIEAVRIGPKSWRIEPTGRNERLIRRPDRRKPWRHNRRGWTIAELADSLCQDSSIIAGGFDFPFSIPVTLLKDSAFAEACRGASRQPPAAFGTRNRWMKFLRNQVQHTFGTTLASSKLKLPDAFEHIRDSRWWLKRATDIAASAQPPLKHQYQSMFNMTILGGRLLCGLKQAGYRQIPFDTATTPTHGPGVVFETYPALIARHLGFSGRYKREPIRCIDHVIGELTRRGISLAMDARVKRFCRNYRTAGGDPDAADAFLCLAASICYAQKDWELCADAATASQIGEEGAIIVPRRYFDTG